jgi:hypothetical protein
LSTTRTFISVSFYLVGHSACNPLFYVMSSEPTETEDSLAPVLGRRAQTKSSAVSAAAVRTDADKSALLDAALHLSQTQLQLQLTDETSLDGRTMGLLAFNGALVAADIAAKSLLHGEWWTILPAVGFSALLCLRSALAKTSDVGVEAYAFFTQFGAGPSLDTREALLADLNIAFKVNAKRIRIKTWSLRVALASLAIGLAVAAFLISGDLSSRVKACRAPQTHAHQSVQHLCLPRSLRAYPTSGQPAASSSCLPCSSQSALAEDGRRPGSQSGA